MVSKIHHNPLYLINIKKYFQNALATLPGNFTMTQERFLVTQPHMSRIGWKNKITKRFHCGGSLISENFVITAAVCKLNSRGKTSNIVQLGNDSFIDVKNFINHPSYNQRTRHNDIALVELSTKIRCKLKARTMDVYYLEKFVFQLLRTFSSDLSASKRRLHWNKRLGLGLRKDKFLWFWIERSPNRILENHEKWRLRGDLYLWRRNRNKCITILRKCSRTTWKSHMVNKLNLF